MAGMNFLRRCGFRRFVIFLGAVYFTFMYVFHSNLQMGREPERDDYYANVGEHGAAGVTRRTFTRLNQEAARQEIFDNIQKDLLENNPGRNPKVELRINIPKDDGANPKINITSVIHSDIFANSTSDENIPSNCRKDLGGDVKDFEFLEIASDIYVYSAYWDTRPNDFDNQDNGTYVRIMAVNRNKRQPRLLCEFVDENTGSIDTSPPIRYYEMCENHGRPYGGYILSCRVPKGIKSPPCYVRVTTGADGQRVSLRIRTLEPVVPRRDFTICVPPLFGDIGKHRLIEFLEMSREIGFNHVVFYVFNVTPEIEAILRYYRQFQKTVSLVKWRLNPDIDKGIWYHGQLVAIQDCLYRNMALSSYIAFNDIDELIVPHKVTYWSEMIRELDAPSRCGFQFQGAYFDPSFVGNNETVLKSDTGSEIRIETLSAIWRTTDIDRIRTKCMVKPTLIFEKGIHHISKPIWARLETHRVDANVAYLHHYKQCKILMGFSNCQMKQKDDCMYRYKDKSLVRILEANKILSNV